ncbi:hypothetical protein D3C76_474500 [compost metagenome]
MEAESGAFVLRQFLPVGAAGFQQAVGTNDVGLDEVRRAVDRAVYVGFGGQVHDGIGLEARKHGTDRGLIDDIGLDELIAGVGRDTSQRFQVAGIRQLVEVEHFVFGVVDQMAYQCRTNEASTAGNKNAHRDLPSLKLTNKWMLHSLWAGASLIKQIAANS